MNVIFDPEQKIEEKTKRKKEEEKRKKEEEKELSRLGKEREAEEREREKKQRTCVENTCTKTWCGGMNWCTCTICRSMWCPKHSSLAWDHECPLLKTLQE